MITPATPPRSHVYEYTASGVSYTRLTSKAVREDPKIAETLKPYLKSCDGVSGHRFSLLYNAFTEKNFPDSFKHVRDSYYRTHADSGGLQIITQGATVTPEMKKTIYLNQAKNSDIAMSFDEIPLLIVGGSSQLRTMSTRFFDKDGYQEKARQSGLNLIEQINLFKDQKSEAKPMLIIHGNTFDNANEWVDIMLDTIPADDHKYIGGIAMGGGSFGMSEKEMILRTCVAASILKRHTHLRQYLHFLGVGSMRSIYPIIFVRNGGWLDGIEISYDSTSHTAAPVQGRYYKDGCIWVDITRVFGEVFYMMLDDIKRLFPAFPFTVHEFHEAMTITQKQYVDRHGHPGRSIEAYVAFVMACIRNFQAEFWRCDQNPQNYLETYVDGQDWGKYQAISKINSAHSYKAWDREFGGSFKSMRMTEKPHSLLDFV